MLLPCPHCSHAITVEPRKAEQAVTCPGCKKTLTRSHAAEELRKLRAEMETVDMFALEAMPKPEGPPTETVMPGIEVTDTKSLEPGDAVSELLTVARDGSNERYKDLKEIARGGIGTIHQVTDGNIGRDVAMKVLRGEKGSAGQKVIRFIEEAQVTGQLDHPNIVPVHEIGINAEGQPFFTMKLVQGRSLQEILDGIRLGTVDLISKYSLTELLNVFLKVCDAVAFAHARGVIHRDLKPANIMVGAFGEVLVMDWGLAKVLGQGDKEEETGRQGDGETNAVHSLRSDQALGETGEGKIQGTLAYMPPEQAEGRREAMGPHSDVYSLGAILYQILCLDPPIQGDTFDKALENIKAGLILLPERRNILRRDIPPELSAVTMKALSREISGRYNNVDALAQDVRLFLEGRAVSAKEDNFFEGIAKLIRRKREIFATATAAALLLATFGIYSFSEIVQQKNRAIDARRNEGQQRQAADRERINVIKANRETARRFANQALDLIDAGRMREARQRAEDALEIADDTPYGWYAQAMIAQAENLHREALELFKVALERDRNHTDSKLAMTKSQLALNELAKVAAVFEMEDEYGEDDTPNPALETDLDGNIADLFAVDLEEETPEIKIEEDINDWRAILKYADTAMQLGRYDRAEQGYQQALEAMEIEDVLPFEIDYAKRKKAQARVRGLCEPWYAERDKLSGTEKAQAVLNKMNEVNPDRPDAEASPWRYQVQRGRLVAMTLENGAFTQFLEPLKGLLLRELTFSNCPRLADLTSLKGMAIGSLTLNDCTALEDLEPLKGMPLAELVLRNCPQLDDLSPLEGIPLTSLVIEGCGNIADISLLKDMPLERLEIDSLGAKNLDVLHGMPLKQLKLGRMAPDEPAVPMNDLNFLAGMPLEQLALRCDGATDLSPISGMPLTELAITSDTLADISPIATLEPLESLALNCGKLESIEPLGELLLARLDLSYCDRLADISPLEGMLLEWLSLDLTGVNDLSPLKDMPLTNFFCGHWKSITDPSGLEHISNPGLRDNVALVYINQGKWKDAERVYLSMLEAWPESDLPARGLRFIAQSYLTSGKHDETQRLCQARIDALSSPAAKALFLMMQARTAIEKGEYETASKLFLRIADSWQDGPFFPELILSAYILGETLPMANAANQPESIIRALLPPDVGAAIEEPPASPTIELGPTDVSLAFRTYSGWANQHLVKGTMSLPKNAVHFFIACRRLLTGDQKAAASELQKCMKMEDGNGYGMQARRMTNDPVGNDE